MKTKTPIMKIMEASGIEFPENMRYSPKPIVIDGEESKYVICTDGSCYNTKTMKAKAHTVQSNGYEIVTLSHNNKSYTFYVHRLVAMAFIRNPKNKPEVNHKDRNKSNNDISNLEWVTGLENMKHAMETADGTAVAPGTKRYTHDQIAKCIKLLKKGNKSITEISNETGVSRQTIYDIKNKKAFISDTDGIEFTSYEKFKDSKKYSDEQIKQVCELLVENKLTPPEIGKKVGIPQSYILEILSLDKRKDISSLYDFSNYDKKIHREEYPEETIKKIEELLIAGYRNRDIRDMLGFPKDSVRFKSVINNRKNALRKLGKIQ